MFIYTELVLFLLNIKSQTGYYIQFFFLSRGKVLEYL